MSRCHASVLIEQTTKSIEVIFSSGSQITYIGDGLATTLGLPTKAADVATILENIANGRSTWTRTASITLILWTVQQVIEAVVLPSGLTIWCWVRIGLGSITLRLILVGTRFRLW